MRVLPTQMANMSLRAFWISLVLLAVGLCGTARATTLVMPDGTERPQPFQGWVDAALVPTPPGDVTLSLDGCPGEPDIASCAPVGAGVLALSRDWADRHVVLHELGHVFDDLMPAWARTQFMRLIKRRGAWAPPRSSTPPNEQFAEAYARGSGRPFLRARHYSADGYAPTPRAHDRVCALVRRAGAAML